MLATLGVAPGGRDLGGAVAAWYSRPDVLCCHRPATLRSRTSSGASRTTIRVTRSWVYARTSSKVCACSTVRGKPSMTKPRSQSLRAIRSRMSPATTSSGIKPSASITSLHTSPRGVRSSIASRMIPPTDMCGMFSLATMCGACDPFPAPGGPNSTITSRASPPSLIGNRLPLPFPLDDDALDDDDASMSSPLGFSRGRGCSAFSLAG
mmetsp:Transcript_11701/g.45410  ORF Transcript_11701/g.45410 Transcript_11701/m.45410 type:complete len:208 (+) Transcript_11701:573-1196(+)